MYHVSAWRAAACAMEAVGRQSLMREVPGDTAHTVGTLLCAAVFGFQGHVPLVQLLTLFRLSRKLFIGVCHLFSLGPPSSGVGCLRSI